MKPAAQRYETAPRKERAAYQLEMGTKSLLAAFFALAVVCGLFFTFGYTIGKHAIPATFSLGGAPQVAARPSSVTPAAASAPGVQPPNPQQLGAVENNQTPSTLTPAQTLPAPAAAPPASAPAQSTQAAGAGSTSGASGLFEVQVFSGNQADANTLADALKARGYPAQVVPPAPGADNALYLVQVGPYLTQAEAEAMRARLRADGYQAVLQGGGN